MSAAERIMIWGFAKAINSGGAADARRLFDEKYSDRPEEWRRDIWMQAAERAETMKVSR